MRPCLLRDVMGNRLPHVVRVVPDRQRQWITLWWPPRRVQADTSIEVHGQTREVVVWNARVDQREQPDGVVFHDDCLRFGQFAPHERDRKTVPRVRFGCRARRGGLKRPRRRCRGVYELPPASSVAPIGRRALIAA